MTLRVGLVGCGNISDIYLTNAPLFRDLKVVACADLNPAAAERQAERYGIEARGVEALLASSDIDAVLNLTVPAAHASVSLAALDAGKHVYSEKPLAATLDDGRRIVASAREKGLYVGGAPDTVLGASIQDARAMIDAGTIGTPLLGVASFLSHGMEHWHPNPAFFFQRGGGPVFDMGPYYIATLVTLLGPVGAVTATGQIGFTERTVTTPDSPHIGTSIKVETLTSVQALLEFESGAQVTFLTSWDVWRHGLQHIELHGTKASLRVPDPNWFGGPIEMAVERGEWSSTTPARPFAEINYPRDAPAHANYRGLGLAEMARAIAEGRPARCSGDLALHVLGVLAAILQAAEEKRTITDIPRCDRPAAFPPEDAATLLA